MGVSALYGLGGDLGRGTSRTRARLWRGARPLAAAPADAEGAALMAALQPAIERQGSLVVHLVGAERSCGTTHVFHALARAALRHRWCRLLLVDAGQLAGEAGRETQGAALLTTFAEAGTVPLAGRTGPLATPLVAAGAGVPRPAELRALYDALRERFNLVLVDCPPVTTSPDTAILSSAADQTILVVRAERSRADAASSSARLLEQAGVTRLGAVLNGQRRRVPAIVERLL